MRLCIVHHALQETLVHAVLKEELPVRNNLCAVLVHPRIRLHQGEIFPAEVGVHIPASREHHDMAALPECPERPERTLRHRACAVIKQCLIKIKAYNLSHDFSQTARSCILSGTAAALYAGDAAVPQIQYPQAERFPT